MRCYVIAVVVLVCAVCLAFPAHSDQVVLKYGVNNYYATTDSYMNSQSADTNYGSSYYMELYMAYQNPRRSGLIKFDITNQIPENSIINSATLSLYLADKLNLTSGDYVYVAPFRVGHYRPWVESQVTWNMSRSGVYWSSPGCESVGWDRSGTPDCNPLMFHKDSPFSYYHWDVKSSVEAWYNGSANNNGWLMRITGHDGGTDGVAFYTKEYSPGWRPYLTVDYTIIPEPSGMLALSAGLLGIAAMRRRRS